MKFLKLIIGVAFLLTFYNKPKGFINKHFSGTVSHLEGEEQITLNGHETNISVISELIRT